MNSRKDGIANTSKIVGSDDAIFMLSKLKWEIEQIINHPQDGVAVRLFKSVNCAITAWHLQDWIWKLSDARQRELLERLVGVKRLGQPFDVAVQKWCPAVGLCRQIATPAKHLGVVFDEPSVTLSGEFDDEAVGHATRLFITNGSDRHPDTDVYIACLDAWSQVYSLLGLPQALEVSRALRDAHHGKLPEVWMIDIQQEETARE